MNTNQPVKIVGEITVDPNHVGQTADIIVYASFATLDDPDNPIVVMLGENGTILPWNSQPASLIPFVSQIQLQAKHSVDIYNAALPEGRAQIFFGYLLDDALVVSEQPVEIATETIPEAQNIDTVLASAMAYCKFWRFYIKP